MLPVSVYECVCVCGQVSVCVGGYREVSPRLSCASRFVCYFVCVCLCLYMHICMCMCLSAVFFNVCSFVCVCVCVFRLCL